IGLPSTASCTVSSRVGCRTSPSVGAFGSGSMGASGIFPYVVASGREAICCCDCPSAASACFSVSPPQAETNNVSVATAASANNLREDRLRPTEPAGQPWEISTLSINHSPCGIDQLGERSIFKQRTFPCDHAG